MLLTMKLELFFPKILLDFVDFLPTSRMHFFNPFFYLFILLIFGMYLDTFELIFVYGKYFLR